MKHGPSPRTGSSGGEPGATDWSVRGKGENTTKRRPGLEHPGRSGARPKPPDWIVWGRTRCHGLEHPRQRRGDDKKTLRIGATRGGMKHGTSPRTGSSGGEPGATDWSVRGNGENTSKRRPGWEHPGRSGARPKPLDWIIWGRTRCHGLERPRQRREYVKKTPRIGASGAEWSTAQAPGLDHPGVNPVPRTGATEATERIQHKDASDWSIGGGVEQGPSPRTGSSGGEPGATDRSIQGKGENTLKRRPGMEQSGRNEARH